MAEADNKKALALELQQIILADRMAADVIRNAKSTRKSIEAATEKEKAAILAAAEKQKADITNQVKADQVAALEKRQAEITAQLEGQRSSLDEQMQAHRDEWVDAIVARVTGG